MRMLMVLVTSCLGLGLCGCPAGGVGDPCVPEDEYRQDFSGFALAESNTESRSFQCETRVCLVANFQGRVSCPLGQAEAVAKLGSRERQDAVEAVRGTLEPKDTGTVTAVARAQGCLLPGTSLGSDSNLVTSTVPPQLTGRRPADAVYCSCRCANAEGKTDDGAHYCDCPENFACQPVMSDLGFDNRQLAGSYCVKKNKIYRSGEEGLPCRDLTQCPL